MRSLKIAAGLTAFCRYFGVDNVDEIEEGNVIVVKVGGVHAHLLLATCVKRGTWTYWYISGQRNYKTEEVVDFATEVWHFMPGEHENDKVFSSSWELSQAVGEESVEAFIMELEKVPA